MGVLTPEGEEIASDGCLLWRECLWTLIPILLWICLCCVCLFFQIEPRFVKAEWERAEWERLQGENTHAFFFAHLVCR